MRDQIDILTTSEEFESRGYMRIKEWGHDTILRFLMPEDFRGKLTKVTWQIDNGDKHVINAGCEEWGLFSQTGERPEITVPSTWLNTLGESGTTKLRIMFSFSTFRQNPDWFAYLYVKTANGDPDAPYVIGSNKGGSGSGTGKGCENCTCESCEGCSCCDPDADETDDSLVR